MMPRDLQSKADTLQWLIAALNSIEMVTVPWWFINLLPAEGLGDTELCEMCPDRILDQHGSGSMQHQHALLIDRLHLREPHVRACDRFANGFGIRFIVLLGLHVGFDVCRRHEPDLVAKLFDRARPVMRRCAGFDSDEAGFELCEEALNLRATKLTAKDLLAPSVDGVGVKMFFAISRSTVTGCAI